MTKPLFVILLLVFLLSASSAVICTTITNDNNTPTTYHITCDYFTKFQKSDTLYASEIVAADSYSFLLVKNTMNITTFDQFLSSSSLTLGIPNNNVMMDNSLLNAQQFINTFHLNDNNKKLIVNISLCTEDVTLTNFRGIPHYDVLLLTDANIANYLDINFNEFHPIILFPSRVCLLNKTSTHTNHTNSVAVNEEDDVIVNEIKQMIKDDIFKRDFSMDLFNGQLLSSLIGLGNFSDENLMKIFINSLNSNLIYNSSYYNIATQQLQLYENVTNISLTWNEIVNRLKQCNIKKETVFDFHIFYIFVCIILQIIFWVFITITKLYKKPTLKRRLLMPYIFSPIFILVYTSTIYHKYSIFLRIFGGCLVFSLLTIYTLTVIRFYYLRNLYHILQRSSYYKTHKILSSNKFGYIVTSIIPLFIFLICWMIYLLVVKYVPAFSANAVNVISVVAVLISSFLAFLCLFIDLILNLGNIRKFGWKKFLFFDDPFYLRIDLVCITLIFLLTVTFTVPMYLELPVGQEIFFACDFLIFILSLMLSGGTALMIHLFNYLKQKHQNNNKKLSKLRKFDSQLTEKLTTATINNNISSYYENNNNFYFQYLLQNNLHFYTIFKDYAKKEFSLENLLLFDKIKEFSKRGSVILEELLDIKEEFIDRFSKSQVNISSNSKKQFLKLIEDCSQSEMKSVDSEVLENILLYDVLLNLSDTNDRLTQTSYYKTWEQVYKIQLEENVV